MRTIVITLSCLLMFSIVTPASAGDKALTEETGRNILKELEGIRLLLEKQQRPQPPQPQQELSDAIKIKGGGTYALGKSDAPFTMIEYTDYQCPFCSRFRNTDFQ